MSLLKNMSLLKKGFFVIVILGTVISSAKPPVYSLPPPREVHMILEESIFRRCSIREFSDDPVSHQDLSNILWAAYGFRKDETRTVPPFGDHGVGIYVLIRNGQLDVYKYDPLNHSLIFYKKISPFMFGQYRSPVYIGIVWNTSKNERSVGAEIGAIGQNIAFMANALNLGCVINLDILPWSYLARIDLPESEKPRILIPLGHPKYPYDFRYHPWYLSLLPRIRYSNTSLFKALKERKEYDFFGGRLTPEEEMQMIGMSYGFSYLIDRTESDFFYHISRHRTVPSAHGYYPLRIYACTPSGIYLYHPNVLLRFTPYPDVDFFGLPILPFMQRIVKGDYRKEISSACSRSLDEAPLIIIPILDLEKTRPEGRDDYSGEDFRWIWYYEAGACTQNILLEAAAWNLSANFFPIKEGKGICSLLKLDDTLFIPLYAIPIGS